MTPHYRGRNAAQRRWWPASASSAAEAYEVTERDQGSKVHLSEMERAVLMKIREQGGVRPKRIAVDLGFKPPSVRRTLQQLRSKGLITKNDDETYELLIGPQTDLASKVGNDLAEEKPDEELSRPALLMGDTQVTTAVLGSKQEYPFASIDPPPSTGASRDPTIGSATRDPPVSSPDMQTKRSRSGNSSCQARASHKDGYPRIRRNVMVPRCPRDAGKKLFKNAIAGYVYTCVECGLSFNEPLQLPDCPSCNCNQYVGRKQVKHAENDWQTTRVQLRCRYCDVSFPLNSCLKYKRRDPKVDSYIMFHAMKGLSGQDLRQGLQSTFHIPYQLLPSGATISTIIRDTSIKLAPHLLSIPLPTSGFIYLDELCEPTYHERADWKEYWWVWNSYDHVQDLWLCSLISKRRDSTAAVEVLRHTLLSITTSPEQVVYLICDGQGSYPAAYWQLVADGEIDQKKVVLIAVPKTQIYSIVNEIESFHSRIRRFIQGKLRPDISVESAQARLDGLRTQNLFLEPVEKFAGKTRAANAGVDTQIQFPDWESLSKLVSTADSDVIKRIKQEDKVERLLRRSVWTNTPQNDESDEESHETEESHPRHEDSGSFKRYVSEFKRQRFHQNVANT
jgi:hypothetical protein